MTRSFVMPPPPPLISPGALGAATATLALLVGVAIWEPDWHPPNLDRPHDREGLRYLLPPLPPRVPMASLTLRWLPEHFGNGLWGTGAQRLVVATQRAVEGTQLGHRRAGVHHEAAAEVVRTPGPDTSQGTVYIESELDRPVERDPTSAAPVYPAWLEQNHIEGTVTASFIVDTTGLADSASLRIRWATNPAFGEAVRAAVPGMRFRPAELNGRHVRQLVMQEFRFVIAAPPPIVPHPGLPNPGTTTQSPDSPP
jgi:TonB family protein